LSEKTELIDFFATFFRKNNRNQCCGQSSFDPEKEMCCAQSVVEKIAGQHTKCCQRKPYDSRKNSCCMSKVRN